MCVHVCTVFGPASLCSVTAQYVAHGVQVLVDDQNLHGSHLQSFKCVIDSETVLPRVLTDLVKVVS